MRLIKPHWLKQKISATPEGKEVRRLLRDLRLNTVCREAGCPNRGSCFAEGTATFLILGSVCTRKCRFCNIASGIPEPVEPDEPERLAKAAVGMNLKHVVVTSVTRDDLPDGGSAQFAKTIRELKKRLPAASVEVLIPDFAGNETALDLVLSESPEVLNHNIETIPELYSDIRPGADYNRSLSVLRHSMESGFITKSGLMVGLGETRDALSSTFDDLAAVGIKILTIGQYLAPSPDHFPVARYIPPEEFEEMAVEAERAGIGAVVAAPLVRSSYHAGVVFNNVAGTQNSKHAESA